MHVAFLSLYTTEKRCGLCSSSDCFFFFLCYVLEAGCDEIFGVWDHKLCVSQYGILIAFNLERKPNKMSTACARMHGMTGDRGSAQAVWGQKKKCTTQFPNNVYGKERLVKTECV